jgi:hypothetical protein
MKVYVCYIDYGIGEGCGYPQHIFSSKEDAISWCEMINEVDGKFVRNADYEEMEVE